MSTGRERTAPSLRAAQGRDEGPEPLDFEAKRTDGSESWERADSVAAMIEQFGRFGFKIMLPGGDVHYAALGELEGEYIDRCNCKGFRYHGGPCAHLCTIRQGAVLPDRDIGGVPITLEAASDPVKSEHEISQAVPDGGRVHYVDDFQRRRHEEGL